MSIYKVDDKTKQQMNEAIEEVKGSNIGDSALSTVPKEQEIAVHGQFKGVNIQGLESIPASMVAVPYCRLIQPTSKKTELANGQEAPLGSFFFNDIQESVPMLNFVLLRAKHELKRVDKDGQFVQDDYVGVTSTKPVVSILGITTDTNKLFILSLSATSFSSFGKLIAKLKGLAIDKTWRFKFTAESEKTENAKGKFYIINFNIDKELSEKEREAMGQIASEYGVVLDRQNYAEDQ